MFNTMGVVVLTIALNAVNICILLDSTLYKNCVLSLGEGWDFMKTAQHIAEIVLYNLVLNFFQMYRDLI